MMPVPNTIVARHRRLRATPALRDLFREQRVSSHDLVAPLFVTDDLSLGSPVETFPGIRRYHLDEVVDAAGEIANAGVRGILVFGVPGRKDDMGSGAWDSDGVVARSISAIRGAGIELALIADVCLCQYTTHGHCGVLASGQVVNDATLEYLANASVTYAKAGASLVAPSGMMDGAVGAIRNALDATGFRDVGILAYAVKHASALYGPFRDAARSAPALGDRRGYQLDPANAREALREAATDLHEGADVIMVKPALTNLDTLVRLRLAHPGTPLAAYEVSGEYAMLQAAAERGWLHERDASLEVLTAIKRAGADLIITYRAVAAARWIREGAFA
jgi:porphobilinogen synthase